MKFAMRPVYLIPFVVAIGIGAADAPRYHFELGQELQYKGAKKDWYREKPNESKFGWRLWVTKAINDASWDVVVEPDMEEDGFEKFLVRITLDSDGRIPWNSTMEALPAWLSLRRILPMLPTEMELAKSQWMHKEPRTGLLWEYRGKPNGVSLPILATCRGPLEIVSVGSEQFTWTLDMTKGSVSHSDEKGIWENYKQHDEQSLALADVVQHDSKWIASFRDETERYFKAAQEYKSRFAPHDWAVRVRAASTIGLDSMLKQGREFLEAGETGCENAIVRDHFARLLKRHDAMAKSAKQDLEEFRTIVDKDSPEWTADGIDGKAHSLADYRGKVVVLDFWFRRCNYCIRAQPQVDAVVEHFKKKPVQFLGMNVDDDVEDAKFAVAQLHTPYPTLRGATVQNQYGNHGQPMWLILDKRGVVRSIHLGYSGNLEEELTESIAKLLE